MRLKNFSNYRRINESEASKASKISGEVKLYRLTSHPVVDLSDPGEFYVASPKDIDPNLLKNKKGDELFLIIVKTNSDNIDLDESEKQCAVHDCNSIVSVKNSEKCELVKVEPYNKK